MPDEPKNWVESKDNFQKRLESQKLIDYEEQIIRSAVIWLDAFAAGRTQSRKLVTKDVREVFARRRSQLIGWLCETLKSQICRSTHQVKVNSATFHLLQRPWSEVRVIEGHFRMEGLKDLKNAVRYWRRKNQICRRRVQSLAECYVDAFVALNAATHDANPKAELVPAVEEIFDVRQNNDGSVGKGTAPLHGEARKLVNNLCGRQRYSMRLESITMNLVSVTELIDVLVGQLPLPIYYVLNDGNTSEIVKTIDDLKVEHDRAEEVLRQMMQQDQEDAASTMADTTNISDFKTNHLTMTPGTKGVTKHSTDPPGDARGT